MISQSGQDDLTQAKDLVLIGWSHLRIHKKSHVWAHCVDCEEPKKCVRMLFSSQQLKYVCSRLCFVFSFTSALPALVSCPRSFLISTMALYLRPFSSQNLGVQPENSQAPTAPVNTGCVSLVHILIFIGSVKVNNLLYNLILL